MNNTQKKHEESGCTDYLQHNADSCPHLSSASVDTTRAVTRGDRPYIEHDCTIEHEGKAFTAGGAYITDRRIIAYPGANGVLNNWHGDPIGTWRAVSTWKTPRSYMSSTMSQIEATVNGIRYTGRGAGEGMVFKGKAKQR